MLPNQTHQLTLFRGPGKPGVFPWSPFVIKVEARLRFAGVSYRVENGSPMSAPRGKIPYATLGDMSLSDSTFIIKDLVREEVIPDLNANISPIQKAQDLAFRALMEDKVYFYGTREKWCDNYDTMRSNTLASIPWPLQILVGWMAYRATTRTLYGQGTGRLRNDEVAGLREEVWESVNALLTEARSIVKGGMPFWALGGSEPTEVDAVLFGFTTSALICIA